jgi:hypothetical protein
LLFYVLYADAMKLLYFSYPDDEKYPRASRWSVVVAGGRHPSVHPRA